MRRQPVVESDPQQHGWAVIALLFVITLINYADRTSITAVYPLLQRDLGFSDVGLGAIGSAFLWSYALGSPFAGYVADRLSRRRVVLWSLAGWSTASLLTGLSAAPWQLLSMRAFLGVAESLFLPAAYAWVAECHPPQTRGTAIGLLNVGQYLGMVCGGAFAGYIGGHYGWRVSECLLGTIGVAVALLCYRRLPRRDSIAVDPDQLDAGKPGTGSFVRTATELMKTRSFVVLAVAGILTNIGTWVFINWLPLYFKESFGMTLLAAGFVGSAAVSVAGAVSNIPGGLLSDFVARRGSRYRMLLQCCLTAASAPLLLVFPLTHNLTAILIALTLYSMFRNGGELNAIPLLSELAGRTKMSTAFGLTNMLNTAAGGMGVFAAGMFKAGMGLSGVFAAVSALLVLASLLLCAGYLFFLNRDLAKNSEVPAIAPQIPYAH